jgi:hypothetical protein
MPDPYGGSKKDGLTGSGPVARSRASWQVNYAALYSVIVCHKVFGQSYLRQILQKIQADRRGLTLLMIPSAEKPPRNGGFRFGGVRSWLISMAEPLLG